MLRISSATVRCRDKILIMSTSLRDLFVENNALVYCAHCRGELPSDALRCARCKVVHYCSRNCQKNNFPLHKKWCKQIGKFEKLLQANEVRSPELKLNHTYWLAHNMLELAYYSTDTIERGRNIYENALLKFYGLLRMDPFYIGACESVVLLLALLGYDKHCVQFIQFMLHPPKYVENQTTREDAIRSHTLAYQDQDSDKWIYYYELSETTIFSFEDISTLRNKIPNQWCPNVFLVPLMLIKMRQQSSKPASKELREEIVLISRQVEYEAHFLLPVLRSLFPDSNQRWGPEEVCALLANVDHDKKDDDANAEYKPNDWEQHCSTFWMMLKDCYAFTPGILDVVEETMDAMQSMGNPAIPEDPPDAPTTAEYMDFVSYMAKQQRQERL